MQSAAPLAAAQASDSCTSSRGGVDGEFSVYVGNLDPDTSLQDAEELLYELFLQAGPLKKVYIPFSNGTDNHKGYGFVEFQHVESVPYCLQLMAGIRLCGRVLNLAPASPALRSPASSSTTTTPTTTASTGTTKNPFQSALKTHVAQKEAELVASNPFLSSLNTHLGGPLPLPLLPPTFPLPPPLPPSGLPQPPPGLPPPIFPLPPPPSLPPPLLPPLLPPQNTLVSTPLSQTHNLPPLFPFPLKPPTIATNPPISLMDITSTAADNGTQPSLPPVPLFGTVPLPTEERKSDSPGMFSLEQTVADMTSNCVDHNGTLSPLSVVQNDQFVESVAETSKQQLMDTCPMSLQSCLNGQDCPSPYPTDVPQSDEDSYQTLYHKDQRTAFYMNDELPQGTAFNDFPTYQHPAVPIDNHDGPFIPPLMGPPATKLHRSRVGANDHPAWMTQQVKDNLRNHHLSELQDTITRLKEAMMNSSSPTPYQ